MYIVYTDGAYSSKYQSGGIGIVILKDDKIVYTYSKQFKDSTNQKMEVIAVIYALNLLKDATSLKIITDSMYVIGCASLNWKIKKNKALWRTFNKYYKNMLNKGCKIEFEHVKGHNGDNYNEMCDKLAVTASKENEI